LQYYADPQQRKEWADQFPDDPFPLHKDPVCDRDQELPTPRRK